MNRLVRSALAALFVVAALVRAAAAETDAETDPPSAAEAAAKADGEVEPEQPRRSEKELCALIESAAGDNGVPVPFFTRLIWKESAFRADAISPKGAQGIAQFMPGTAAERGLLDPFDVATALPASAGLLADLQARFGNLGLAAAAYNAGAQRVSDWLAGTSTLPGETQDYVVSITGVPADTWSDAEAGAAMTPAGADEDCLAITALLKVPGSDIGPSIATASGPWGVQVAGNFSRSRAVKVYTTLQARFPALMGDRPPMVIGKRMRGRGTRAFYHVRVPMPSRKEADNICADLRAAGAPCIVLKT